MATLQLGVAARNARLDALETLIGASPVLEIRVGSLPANVAASRTGAILATVNLPSDWMLAASGGAKSMSGSWADASADNTGTAGYYCIKDSGGTYHLQGDVTITGGGGAMTVDSVSFTAGQGFTITSYTWNEGNA